MRHLRTFEYVDAVVRVGSIRKAAEVLSITPSALNRRIQALEEDLGEQVFERLPRGVRLSAAGEILIQHIREQISDMDQVKSKIADLSGVRRGNVNIACSQALIPYFLPEQITRYRQDHPAVTFAVYVRDRTAAEEALASFAADIALVFEPVRFAKFYTLLKVKQPVHAVMAADHPLAEQETVRLRDCLQYPVAMPSKGFGVRQLLESAVARTSLRFEPMIESDSFDFLRHLSVAKGMVSFQIPIGLATQTSTTSALAHIRVDPRDLAEGVLYMGQLQGRSLPVAAARFADQLATALNARYDCK